MDIYELEKLRLTELKNHMEFLQYNTRMYLSLMEWIIAIAVCVCCIYCLFGFMEMSNSRVFPIALTFSVVVTFGLLTFEGITGKFWDIDSMLLAYLVCGATLGAVLWDGITICYKRLKSGKIKK